MSTPKRPAAKAPSPKIVPTELAAFTELQRRGLVITTSAKERARAEPARRSRRRKPRH